MGDHEKEEEVKYTYVVVQEVLYLCAIQSCKIRLCGLDGGRVGSEERKAVESRVERVKQGDVVSRVS